MAENHENGPARGSYDPFALARGLDWCAKWWWGASLILKLLGFVAGASVVLPFPAEPVPFIVAVFTLLSEFSSYRSDAIKSRAQWLRRKLDLQDSLGWQMSGAEMSDLLVRCPRSVKVRASADKSDESYFASKEPPGAARALQNIAESAWWSKHLSERMGLICVTVLTLGVAAAVAVLLIALQTLGQTEARASVAKIVTALLMFFLSMGIVRLSLGYYGLAKNAARSEEAAALSLQSGRAELIDAINIMNEYHVTRATGPIIPTWIWKLRRAELNTTWARYRTKP